MILTVVNSNYKTLHTSPLLGNDSGLTELFESHQINPQNNSERSHRGSKNRHNSRLFERALLLLWLKKLKGCTRFCASSLRFLCPFKNITHAAELLEFQFEVCVPQKAVFKRKYDQKPFKNRSGASEFSNSHRCIECPSPFIDNLASLKVPSPKRRATAPHLNGPYDKTKSR
jgi:hypothetical protein